MMKNFKIAIVIVLVSSFSLTAQNKDTQTADKLFSRFEYVDAIKEYTKLIEKGKADAYVYGQLAEANYNIFNTQEAEKWYAKVLETSQDAETMYKYAQMLKANGKYEEANQWMNKFASMEPNDERAKAFKSNTGYLSGILNGEAQYELTSLGFNSEATDFGGTVQDDKLYFSSSRNTARKDYGWNDQPYLDIYAASKGSDGNYMEPEAISGLNSKYHEGLVSFSPDGNTVYFSRESFYDGVYEKNKENRTKISIIHLFKANKDGGSWKNVEALPFNNQAYSVKNPSVSKDGNTLYFASDMPGGLGKFDIYKASINADGTFGEPENLGSGVNTEEQEMFPYISDNGTLYFSSTGKLGLGGLDVFYVDESGKAVNMGVPVNSNADDLAFTINEETGAGFVSSNRDGGKGSDDIYAVKRLEPCLVMVSTTVVDSNTLSPIPGTSITIADASGQTLTSGTTDSNGKFSYETNCEKSLVISGKKDQYESNSVTFVGSKQNEADVQLSLRPIEEIIEADKVVLNPILFEFDKWNITSQGAFELDKLVSIMQKYPDMVIRAESHTDKRGPAKYNEQLSDKRAKSTVQYVISKGIDASRITGVGKGESEPVVDCGKCTEEEHQKNRRSEFIIVSGGPQQQ